jgi:hypothetical protein
MVPAKLLDLSRHGPTKDSTIMPLTSLTDTSTDASPQFATDASLTLAVVGSGGAGAITTDSLLLEAAGRAGWYGLMSRSVGPQIRGGEALATVRLATTFPGRTGTTRSGAKDALCYLSRTDGD